MADEQNLEEGAESGGGMVGGAVGSVSGMASQGTYYMKKMTTKEGRDEILNDETMEPHVHLAILLLIVFFISIVIAIAGI